MVKMAAIG